MAGIISDVVSRFCSSTSSRSAPQLEGRFNELHLGKVLIVETPLLSAIIIPTKITQQTLTISWQYLSFFASP
jgi:hypothetical protein